MKRRPWIGALGLALGLVGCHAKPASSEPSTTEPPAPTPTSVAAVPPGCSEGGHVVLSLEPEHLSLACEDGFRECSGRTTLTVRDCTQYAFGVSGLQLRPSPMFGSYLGLGDVVRLEPGDVWTYELELRETGVYEVGLNPIVVYESGAGSIGPRQVTLTVDNPAREQAEAACRECNGDWGPHGMLQLEGCDCRTSDGGTPCDDGADCEGPCMEREPGTGFTCSEFTQPWSCYAYLPEGWSKRAHRRGKVEVPPQVCVD